MTDVSTVNELRTRLGVKDDESLRQIIADPIALLALRSLAGDSIDRMVGLLQEQDQHLSMTATAIKKMAELGWAPSGHMPTRASEVVVEALESGEDDLDIDRRLEGVWRGAKILATLPLRIAGLGAGDDQLHGLGQERSRLLAKAWHHHQEGEYAASIPITLAQIDGITHDATASPANPVGVSLFSSSNRVDAAVADDETVAGMNAALPAVRTWFFDQAVTTSVQGALNRNAVLHGRELAYDTLPNSLKTFVLLLAVWEWASRKFAKEADRRKVARYLQHADSDAVDVNGVRMDRRGFTATRDALRQLAIAQISFAQRNGRCGTLAELQKDVVSKTLVRDPGQLILHMDEPGSWWAWRRSESGWVFAIGGLPGEDRTFYADGESPPIGPPPGEPWRITDDGNWSGDCYW